MANREDVIRGLIVQSNLVEDLDTAKGRAIEQRNQEILEALLVYGIPERTIAAATGLSRSQINKIRRTNRGTSTAA